MNLVVYDMGIIFICIKPFNPFLIIAHLHTLQIASMISLLRKFLKFDIVSIHTKRLLMNSIQ